MAVIVNLFSRDEKEVLERMDVNNFRIEIVRPALITCGLWSESAENLMIGTALAESNLSVVTQFGNGPGLSFFQIEPKTYFDIIKYLHKSDNKLLKERVLSTCIMDMFPDSKCLAWNIRLAVLIARLVYWRKGEPLPSANDTKGMADYWKVHYNTAKGKGTINHFIESYNKRLN